jgi:hypothetical protein
VKPNAHLLTLQVQKKLNLKTEALPEPFKIILSRVIKYYQENFSPDWISNEPNQPKSRFRKLSLRVKRSNLAFFNGIATHLSGARNDKIEKGIHSLNWNLGIKD